MVTSVSRRLAERLNLRFPVLVLALAALTLVDVVVPDFVPFVDEIGLILLTALATRWKHRRAPAPPPASR